MSNICGECSWSLAVSSNFGVVRIKYRIYSEEKRALEKAFNNRKNMISCAHTTRSSSLDLAQAKCTECSVVSKCDPQSLFFMLWSNICYVERKKWENRKKSGKLHHHAAISNLTGQSFTRVMSSLSHSFNRRHLSPPPSSAAVASCRRRAGLCSFSILQVGFFFITKFHHTTSSACVGFCIVNNNRSQRKKNRLSYVKIVHKTWCKLAPSRVQWSFFAAFSYTYDLFTPDRFLVVHTYC